MNYSNGNPAYGSIYLLSNTNPTKKVGVRKKNTKTKLENYIGFYFIDFRNICYSTIYFNDEKFDYLKISLPIERCFNGEKWLIKESELFPVNCDGTFRENPLKLMKK